MREIEKELLLHFGLPAEIPLFWGVGVHSDLRVFKMGIFNAGKLHLFLKLSWEENCTNSAKSWVAKRLN